jgi:hypothetical protein
VRFQCPCPHLRWSDQGVSLQSEFGEVAPPTPRLTMENPLAVHVAARLRSPPGACSDPDRPYLRGAGGLDTAQFEADWAESEES